MRTLLLCSVLLFSGVAAAGQRQALVIGINDYAHTVSLNNARQDAETIAASLRRLDFETTLAVDLEHEDFLQAIHEFSRRISSDSDCALFYFAGHGVQSDGRNYLLPKDFSGSAKESLPQDAIALERVILTLAGAQPKVSVVILDACRNNPLNDDSRPGAGVEGLAPVTAPLGTLIAYSADAGQKAADGEVGGNGLYTGILVQHLEQPGLRVEDVFNRTRRQVSEASGGAQTPAEYSKLVNIFYFQPPPGLEQPDSVIPPRPRPPEIRHEDEAVSAPVIALQAYYNYINQRQIEPAYGMLSSGFQSRKSRSSYEATFNGTRAVYPRHLSIVFQSNDAATIGANLVVVGPANDRSAWSGPVEMVREDGEWKLETTRGLRQSDGPVSLPEPLQPQFVASVHSAVKAIETYFGAVNLRDFDHAYAMLSEGFQARKPRWEYGQIFDRTLATYLISASLSSEAIGEADVYVEMATLDEKGRRSVWSGVIELVFEDDTWKIETMQGLREQ